jgi:hypothetical protein
MTRGSGPASKAQPPQEGGAARSPAGRRPATRATDAGAGPAAGGDAGFTLLELLVAGVLTAMIVALGAGGLNFGARVWERVGATAEARIEERAARRFIARLIEAAEPIRLRDGTRAPPVLFVGEADRLLLVAPLPAALAGPAPQLAALEAERRGAGFDLVLRWRPLDTGRPLDRFGPADGEETILSGLSAVTFRYGDPAALADRWPGAVAPPALVELSYVRDGRRETVAAAPRLRGAT